MIKIKTIDEYNQEKQKQFQIENPQWTNCNIACDKCGKELLMDMWIILCSDPPQRNIKCENCGYYSYVLA